MKVVLDTSAIIYLTDFRQFEEMCTVSEVLEEVKDRANALKLAGIGLKVLEPGAEAVKQVKEAASETGDLKKLSETDLKVLALAKERGLTVVSDDYAVQNVAQHLGMKYISVFNPKITRSVKWDAYCSSCREFFSGRKACPNCGGELARRPKESKHLSLGKPKFKENKRFK